MPRRRHVFVVGCGFPQLGLIRAARALGIETTGADLNPRAIGVPLLDHFLPASTGEPFAVREAFRQSGASGIATSGSELALTTTAAVASDLGLPFYADMPTIHRCQAKDAMRAAYCEAGLDVPQFSACVTMEQARAFAETVGYPLVIKPIHGWGQRGVSRVDEPAELAPAFILACDRSHGGRGAVVEECFSEHELSVNGWVEEGRLISYCVTDREVFPGKMPLGVMRSEIHPSCAGRDLIERAIDLAARGASALGLVRGPCYSQVAVSPHRVMLFETAARLGGGFDADVTRLACGVDLYVRLLGVALEDRELERDGTVAGDRPAMVRFLRPVPGRLDAIEGIDEARNMEGVVDVVVYPRRGDAVPPMTDAAKRIGHVLVAGLSREQIVATADAAEQTIRLAMSPNGGAAG